MKTLNQKIVLLIVLSLGLISCSSNDDGIIAEEEVMEMSENPNEDQLFSATINGEAFNPPNDFVAGSVAIESGFYAIGIVAGVPTSTTTGKGIALAMIGLDFDALEVGEEWNLPATESPLDGATAGYIQDGIETDEIQEISVVLTAIDKEERTFSGTFRFIALDEETNIIYTVTNGVFRDVLYDLN